MKHKQILILMLIIVCLFQHTAGQDVTKVGTSASNFLKIDVGARAAALGGAFVSVANDLSSMYWNPAGLSFNKNLGVQFEHRSLYADMSHNFAGISFLLPDDFVVGISAVYLNSGDIEITTETEWEGTGSYYNVSNMALGVTISRPMTDRLNAGITFKYISESIWRNSANGIAFDFGFIVDTGIYGFNLGMSLTNIGTQMQMKGIDMQFDAESDHTGLITSDAQLIAEKWELPTSFKVGVSSYLIGKDNVFFNSDYSTLLTSVDFINAIDSDLKTHFGLEYAYAGQLFLRAGYKINYDEISFSFGGGVKVRAMGNSVLTLDYSYSNYGIIGDVHCFGIAVYQ